MNNEWRKKKSEMNNQEQNLIKPSAAQSQLQYKRLQHY